MRFDVEVGGRPRSLELIRGAGSRFQVTLDGQPRSADVARVGRSWSLILGPAEAGPCGRSYEISILDLGAGELMVSVDGRPVPVSTAAARFGARLRGRAGGAEGKHGPQAVTAPMPGRIVKLLVARGETVAARQGLIVVEAMKMENELRSPKAGTVTDIRVTEGMSVEANAILIVVE